MDAVLKGIADGLSRGKKSEEMKILVNFSNKIDHFAVIGLMPN